MFIWKMSFKWQFFCNSGKSVLYAPCGSCFVSKFCIWSAVSSTDVGEFMQESNQKENFTGTTIKCHYIYIMQHILLHFQKWPLWGALEIRVFKIWQKGFHVLMASSFRQVLQTYPEICNFCSAIQYKASKKQPVGSVHELSADSSETVFDKAHFIINSHIFLQPLALSKHTFPPSESFVPHSPRQNNFQIPSPLDTSKTDLVCIFSSILNLSLANQKNSIIKCWK